MNKVVNFSILILSLFALEIILDFIFLVLIDCSMYDIEFFFLKKAWRSSAVWNYWRLLFYGFPFLILKIILFDVINRLADRLIPQLPITISIFNLVTYFLFSYLSIIVFGKNVPLPPEGIMFWLTCISIFISPLLLQFIPYFRTIMKEF